MNKVEMEKIGSCEHCSIAEGHDDGTCMMQHMTLSLETVQLTAELFKVLGDTTRLRILHALMGGEMCVWEIAEAMGMGQSAISHQLRILRQTRLVRFRKEGKVVYYSLNDDHVVTLLCQGVEHVSHS